jgi:hypothetical protein
MGTGRDSLRLEVLWIEESGFADDWLAPFVVNSSRATDITDV